MVTEKKEFKPKLAWFNIIAFIYMHLTSIYLLYETCVHFVSMIPCYIFGILIGFCSTVFGIVIGAHRMWAHKAFKARWPTRLFLAFWQTMAGQNSIYEWCRDHRVHHKFSDTDADPHNINNGFFFSHMGWLCREKHPDVREKGKTVLMDDLAKDWIIKYQKKYYTLLYLAIAHILPTLGFHYICGQSLPFSWSASIFRYVITLHITWTTNSFAHYKGDKPYDKNIRPCDVKLLGWIGGGEGWHNFHHAFPWDYKLSEHVQTELKYAWKFIEFFAKIGQAYDLKTVSQEMIKKRVLRTGDGTHPYSIMNQNNNEINDDVNTDIDEKSVWGWDDQHISNKNKNATIISHTLKRNTD
jgi:stearoyl-CoA desaturase (delta-9 desaturase)